MVQCFLIHTVNPVSTLSPGESRVLYSRVFGPEEGALTGADSELGPEQRRLLQNEKVAVVARQLAYFFLVLFVFKILDSLFCTLILRIVRKYFSISFAPVVFPACDKINFDCFFILQVLLKSDRIDVLLHRLLPHGQLLFLNHRFTQSLEKELANYMAQ
uniref:Uncharacterized protein n=1 Tax=Hucho hucho TaxID=62062 RepID=A0A4W5JRU7_9TELE